VLPGSLGGGSAVVRSVGPVTAGVACVIGCSAHTREPLGACALPRAAFVIQFSRETEGAAVFSGRAEHLSSGRRAHFESPDELVAALRKLLVELGTQ